MEDEEDFTSPLDFASLSGMARQANVDVQKQIKNYREMVEAGTRRMREQRIGPSSTERLLALAQALGSPTTTGKFGERMGLIAGTLGGQQRAQREAEIERADTLEKLGLKGAEFELGAAQTRANTLATLMARQMAANKPAASVWAPDLNKFVSRDKPVPTQTKVNVGGMVLTQYTDGNLYLRNADGSRDVYSPEGEKIGTIPAGGAR
jgi:hypothetical protein